MVRFARVYRPAIAVSVSKTPKPIYQMVGYFFIFAALLSTSGSLPMESALSVS